MTKKRDEFGDDENPKFQKWEQGNFCFPEIAKYTQCLQRKSKQFQVPIIISIYGRNI